MLRSRRNIELALLLAAAPVVLLAFALVYGEARATLGWEDLAVPGGLLLAFVGAHVAARFLTPGADPVLLPLTAVLSGVGLAFVTRLDPELAASQTLWLLAGVIVLVGTLALVRDLERVARYKYTVMLGGLVLLLLPAFVGKEVNGAKLWLRFGGLSFQPAEVAKVLIVLFLAAYLAEKREVLSVSTRKSAGLWMPSGRHLGPILAMWLVSLAVLVLEKDLGSSLLFFGVFLVMLFVATGRPAYVVVGIGLFGIGAGLAYTLFSHVQTRVEIWLDPFADAAGRGYQLVQSLFAFAAGGMTGTGIGRGLPDRIPFVATDFIFAAVGEELGLLGAAALVVAYLVFCLRGLLTAVRAKTDMAAFTAAGLVATFGLQTFVIVGGVTRLIPLTGITLPFVSYGGSSVVANFILLGLLMRAGDEGVAADEELVSTGHSGTLGRFALAGRMRAVAGALALLLFALVANLTYLQVFAAPALAKHPNNTRTLAEELRRERGAIVTADGVLLAESVADGKGRFRRRYPGGTLAAHVVGYYSPRLGRSGVEAALDEALAGRRNFSSLSEALEQAAGRQVPGNDVVLTLDSRVQRAAQAALRGRKGACVVLDPRDGRVLAMASAPTYEPGLVDDRWRSLSSAAEGPLVNRAARGLYPPGSTFKVVTLTGAIGAGVAKPETKYPGPASIEIGGGKVTNFESGAYGRIDLRTATANSVNTVFGQLAVDLGARRLVDQAEAYGMNDVPPVEIRADASVMPPPAEFSEWELAWAGIGQPVGERGSAGPLVTPLQMALIAAGIANEGVVMKPHLVERIDDHAGGTLSETGVGPWKTASDPATAETVTGMMVTVVQRGSGRRAAVEGAQVAGKTGTAEVSKGAETHAWFLAFAPADEPRIAMVIVLENAGVGGRVAAPAAKPVIEAALAATR